MKTQMFPFVLIPVLAGLFTNGILAQDTAITQKEQKQFIKQQKKEEKARRAAEDKQELTLLLEKRFFVFQASRLIGAQGRSYSVSPNTNFLVVVDSTVTFQFAFDQLVGWNGLGGATFEGYIDNYVFTNNQSSKRPMMVESKVIPATGGGRPYFTIKVYDNGMADLDLIMGGPDHIKMSGRIVNPKQSGIFKGQTIW